MRQLRRVQAECEVVDRKMATLKADIGEQAAEVHRSHKFNSGATEPTGDSSPTKLASGLIGTAEVLPFPSFPLLDTTIVITRKLALVQQQLHAIYLGLPILPLYCELINLVRLCTHDFILL